MVLHVVLAALAVAAPPKTNTERQLRRLGFRPAPLVSVDRYALGSMFQQRRLADPWIAPREDCVTVPSAVSSEMADIEEYLRSGFHVSVSSDGAVLDLFGAVPVGIDIGAEYHVERAIVRRWTDPQILTLDRSDGLRRSVDTGCLDEWPRSSTRSWVYVKEVIVARVREQGSWSRAAGFELGPVAPDGAREGSTTIQSDEHQVLWLRTSKFKDPRPVRRWHAVLALLGGGAVALAGQVATAKAYRSTPVEEHEPTGLFYANRALGYAGLTLLGGSAAYGVYALASEEQR